MKSSEIKATARKVINELAEPIVQRRRKAKVGGDRRGERNRDKEVLEIVRQLTEDGRAKHEVASVVADRLSNKGEPMSKTNIRRIMRKANIN